MCGAAGICEVEPQAKAIGPDIRFDLFELPVCRPLMGKPVTTQSLMLIDALEFWFWTRSNVNGATCL